MRVLNNRKGVIWAREEVPDTLQSIEKAWTAGGCSRKERDGYVQVGGVCVERGGRGRKSAACRGCLLTRVDVRRWKKHGFDWEGGRPRP